MYVVSLGNLCAVCIEIDLIKNNNHIIKAWYWPVKYKKICIIYWYEIYHPFSRKRACDERLFFEQPCPWHTVLVTSFSLVSSTLLTASRQRILWVPPIIRVYFNTVTIDNSKSGLCQKNIFYHKWKEKNIWKIFFSKPICSNMYV